MSHPSAPHVAMPAEELRGFEKVAVPLLEAFNASHGFRRATHIVQGKSFGGLIHLAFQNLAEPHGLAELAKAHVPHGLIVVSNHRTFYDFFYLGTWITFHTPHCKEVLFPVRSPFFYTNPVGVALNLVAAGGSMWPPVFRDERRRSLNPVGVQQIAKTLAPGVMMGIHPEGTRNRQADPHSFLPLKPGLGQLLELVHPEVRVMPAFIAGHCTDLKRDFTRGFRPRGQRGEPIRLWYGEPRSAGSIVAESNDPMLRTEIAFAGVRELAEKDRALHGAGS